MLKITDLMENAGKHRLIVGVGAVLLAPVVIPVVANIGKPVAKSIIKGSMVAYEKSKGAFAELGESWEDIVAEAKAELTEEEYTEIVEVSSTPGEVISDR